MKKFLFACSAGVLLLLSLFIFRESAPNISSSFDPGNTFSQNRMEWENMLLRDPETGKITVSQAQELDFAKGLPIMQSAALGKNYPWKQRGPNNFGGRVRGFAIDIKDPNIFIAGSVTGGIFRSTDKGKSWSEYSNGAENFGITCLAQDTRSGKEKTWYAGTGEFWSSASWPNNRYVGDGMLKSTDGGLSWIPLGSTQSGSPEKIDAWDRVSSVVIDPNASKDVVLASVIGGIMRSEDGGITWARVLGEEGGAEYTNLIVTPTGKFYATLSSDGTTKGVFRSVNGVDWTNITPSNFATIYNRIVCAFDPSNENIVYFFGDTPENGKAIHIAFFNQSFWSSFWKYEFLNGDGSGGGGQWGDRSMNLPSSKNEYDVLVTQNGYCMSIAVSPTNGNHILLGAMNIHLSTTGFADSTHHTFIGGYDINAELSVKSGRYLNHHPDQHVMLFDADNPKMLHNANDGGIYTTSDYSASTVAWEPRNKGLNTIQFYTCGIDNQTNGSVELIGGSQDNGTLRTNVEEPKDWALSFEWDGGFAAIANGGAYHVASQTNGRMFKIKLDAIGNYTSYKRIDPAGADQRYPNNAWAMDPTNSGTIYLPVDKKVWRLDGLDQLVLDDDTNRLSSGWTELPITLGDYAVSVGVSTANPPNRLYLGTSNGRVYRVDNANGPNPIYKTLGTLASGNGIIYCVAVDPLDGDHAMAIVSNYEVHSIHFTKDGGVTWFRAGGNLESAKAPDGANPVLYNKGPAPSVRWGEILHVGNETVYLVGTSVGLFGTNYLAEGKDRTSDSTKWVQLAPDEIGHSVVTMVKARQSDGFVGVATHGRGMYSTNINYTWGVTGLDPKVQVKPSLDIYPNPAHDQLSLRCAEPILAIDIFNLSGRLMKKHDSQSMLLNLDISDFKPGIYLVRVRTEKGIQVKKIVVN